MTPQQHSNICALGSFLARDLNNMLNQIAPLRSFHNSETNMTAFISENTGRAGGFNVTLRDDDSGEYLPARVGFSTEKDAADYARAVTETV